MNTAIWLFSFRYFTISFVVPWRLQQKEEPKWFPCVIGFGFFIGSLANLAIPLAYCYTDFKINGALAKPKDEATEI